MHTHRFAEKGDSVKGPLLTPTEEAVMTHMRKLLAGHYGQISFRYLQATESSMLRATRGILADLSRFASQTKETNGKKPVGRPKKETIDVTTSSDDNQEVGA